MLECVVDIIMISCSHKTSASVLVMVAHEVLKLAAVIKHSLFLMKACSHQLTQQIMR